MDERPSLWKDERKKRRKDGQVKEKGMGWGTFSRYLYTRQKQCAGKERKGKRGLIPRIEQNRTVKAATSQTKHLDSTQRWRDLLD